MKDSITAMTIDAMISKGRKSLMELDKMTENPMVYNEELLMNILRRNQDSEYGRKYGFAGINSIEDYKARVPLSVYDTYAGYINEMKNNGGSYMTSVPPVAFAATSGSVANPKSIPVSAETLEIYRDYNTSLGLAIIDKELNGQMKRGKTINLSEVKMKETPCGKYYGSISGLLINEIRDLLPVLTTSPVECVFPAEFMEGVYLHARFALEYKELAGIFSSFMTVTMDFLNYIKTNWEILTDDIENGTIYEEINIPVYVRDSLADRIKPNPDRARELRKEFSAGFDSTILKRIWPNISFIHTIGCGGFDAYTRKFKKYAGDLPILHSAYMASEALMAVCTKLNSTNYVLIPNSAFFEFIPVENSNGDNARTLTLDELEVGKDYEIVITTTSGLYRYRIMDVIRVVGMYNNCPEIRFAYRYNQMISLGGEKTNEGHLSWAITELEKETGQGIVDYSIFPDTSEETGKYTVLLEPASQEALDSLISNKAVAGILQDKLSVANPSFGDKIRSKMLGALDVKYTQLQTYALYRELMAVRGVSPNQIKPIRIIDTPEKEKFFFKLLEE